MTAELSANGFMKLKNPDYGENICCPLLFEFLEFIINKDVGFLQEFEERMTALEDSLSGETIREFDREILRCRKELLRLNSYYTQLIDIGETLSENHNHILNEDDCRLFQLYVDRVSRLYDTTKDLRESALQIFEMYQSRIDTRQNNIMQFLTVVTTIFLPLTLIAGWYGMNFANMPELGWKYGYLVIRSHQRHHCHSGILVFQT